MGVAVRAAPGTPGRCEKRRRRGYLNANGITFAILADGPYEEIAAFRDFMGYTAPCTPTPTSTTTPWASPARISCYLRREDKIYLTYWTTGRGDEVMSPSFGLLDLTAYGRREEWRDSPEGWRSSRLTPSCAPTSTVRR